VPGQGPGAAAGQSGAQASSDPAETVVAQFVQKVAAGDMAGMDALVSKKAEGDLLALRSGKLGQEDASKVKSALTGARFLTRRNASGKTLVVYENAEQHKIQFLVAREDGQARIVEMTIR
jgi:hypothetical protein